MALTARQCVEAFHLLFLRQLSAGGDRSRFVLKGGCNLRFFFQSLRYSEDMDLDSEVPTSTLKNKVDRLLESPGLLLPLKALGITPVETSAPKQTETTQRWKIGLSVAGQALPVRTKVEFSKRPRSSSVNAAAIEPVDLQTARAYGLQPPLVQHYKAPAALQQKIQALVGRPQTQARDVFDLQLLSVKLQETPELDPAIRRQLPRAVENVMSLSYDAYLSQVVAYLVPEEAEPFRDKQAWDAMQEEIVQLLEGLSA